MNARKPKLADLPPSGDENFWEDAERVPVTMRPITLCREHEMRDNGDGTATCVRCPWGGILAGYQRVQDGKVIDLRELTRK